PTATTTTIPNAAQIRAANPLNCSMSKVYVYPLKPSSAGRACPIQQPLKPAGRQKAVLRFRYKNL
ncbi:MAG: hypothetical protein LBB43_00670, partial [Spirochaetaceae bacterium]|nr:hypothetical protein [Spirochaetaceae bacterium]